MESLDLLSEASESTYPQSMERLVGERAASLRRKGKLPEKSYFGTNRISDKDKKVFIKKGFCLLAKLAVCHLFWDKWPVSRKRGLVRENSRRTQNLALKAEGETRAWKMQDLVPACKSGKCMLIWKCRHYGRK